MKTSKKFLYTSAAISALLLTFFFLGKKEEKTEDQKPISQLESLIPAEVKNDAFYDAIYRLAKNAPIQTILEIGSSSGDGSTEAFVKGMAENPHQPKLFCMEFSKPRFHALKTRYADHPFVYCYNVSSVPLETFPSEKEVATFYQTIPSALNKFPLTEVIRWLRQDIEYLNASNVPQKGIEEIKKEHRITHFDMVLIDGSEFTGKAEFALIYGAKLILLDDVLAFKNHDNYEMLRKDPTYQLIEENLFLRHGYAIFQKR